MNWHRGEAMPKQRVKVGRRIKEMSRKTPRPLMPGRPRIYNETHMKYLTYVDIAKRLWMSDYRPLVDEAIQEHPDLSATVQAHMDAAPGHYRRMLTSNPDPYKLAAYVDRANLRIAEMMEEMDGMASQKVRSVLKEARGISFKIQGIAVAQGKAASYSGNPLSIPQLF